MPRRVQDIRTQGQRSIRDIPVEQAPVPTARTVPRTRKSTRSEIKKPRKAPVNLLAAEPLESHDEDQHASLELAPLGTPLNAVSTPPTVPAVQVVASLPITPPGNFRNTHNFRGLKWVLAILAVVVVLCGAGYIVSGYVAHATFHIVPRVSPISVNTSLLVPAAANAGSVNDLAYYVIPVRGSATTTVAASDGAVQNVKAQGKVTLENAYSATAQRLIAGTRLVGSSGLVYRLTGSVVVPGMTTSASAAVIPGKVLALVVADQPGQDYNISKATVDQLHVAAYKGTPKYDGFYAVLATDIAGGYVGVKKTVNPAVLASTTLALQNQLTSSLLAQAAVSIPADGIGYATTYAAVFSQPTVGGSDKNLATVSVAATVYQLYFKRQALVSKLATPDAVNSFGTFGYTSPGLESLKVAVVNAKDFAPDKNSKLNLQVFGSLKLVGTIPVDAIKKDFAGSALNNTQELLKKYSSVVQSGSGELVPPWAKIPTDLGKITVIVEQP